MIQRMQSLYLLGVVICMSLIFIMPIWEKSDPKLERRITLDAFYQYEYVNNTPDQPNWVLSKKTFALYIAIAAGLAALTALYSIFRYDNRLLQIKLGALNAFLIMATLGICAYLIYNAGNLLGENLKNDFKDFKIGFFLPAIALVLNSLANRFIKKDEDLVRSVDRIR